MKKFILAACLALMAIPAMAQTHPEIRNTPRAVVGGVQVAVWEDAGLIGDCLNLLQYNTAQGAWQVIGFWDCRYGDLQAAINTAGGPAAYINLYVPQINAALAKQFPPSGGAVTPTPVDTSADSINTTLMTGFSFKVSTDGKSAAFGPN